MAKSDIEKYPTILSSFEQFLANEGLEADDADWNALPEYFDDEQGHKVRPFIVKTKCGQNIGLSLSEHVPEYHR